MMVKNKKPFLIILCVGLQYLLSSLLWNHFMLQYHNLLETDILSSRNLADFNRSAIFVTQNQVLLNVDCLLLMAPGQPSIINPVPVTSRPLLQGVWAGKRYLGGKFVDNFFQVTRTQLLGYLPIILVAVGSFIHLSYTTRLIRTVAIS